MRLVIFLGLMLLVCGFALWKGGLPERLVAMLFLIGAVCSMVFRVPYETRFGQMNLEIWITDFVMLVILVMVALFAERYWTIWMSSFQLVQVISHLPELLIPELLPQVHLLIISLWVYPMLLILVIGTWRHAQRTKTYGIDRSWSDFSQQQG
jgi:hypothetical protein